jgi:hypothetical protein|mmetsp:Transcript_54918/g.91491  ORF Transcript_54918/g.91491 Transcript_54918/m.91491 type:complete len:85 (-) Transcript_54918:2536-2790(-)
MKRQLPHPLPSFNVAKIRSPNVCNVCRAAAGDALEQSEDGMQEAAPLARLSVLSIPKVAVASFFLEVNEGTNFEHWLALTPGPG